MKKVLLTAVAAAAALTASAADYTVYQNGVVAPSVNANQWWNCAMNATAANPDGEGAVFELTNGGTLEGNFCMGFQTADDGNAISGPLHSADLSFRYYATTPCKVTVQLGSQDNAQQVITVTDADVNKWLTASYSVTDDFAAVAAQWKEYKQFGANDCLLGLIVENFTADTKLYVDDVVYTNTDESWTKPEIVRFCPEPPVPAADAADVVSLLSGKYAAATTFGIGGWGQSTQFESLTSDGGAPVAHLRNFNYLGWELAQHIDVSECDYMHVDFYPVTATNFGFTPISPGNEGPWVAPEVKVGEWNSYDVPLSHWTTVNFADVFQVKFDQGNTGAECFIANVYFYKDPNAVKPAYGGVWYGSAEATASREGKEYNITVSYALTANEDGTLSVEATFEGTDGLECGHKLHVFSQSVGYDKYMELTYDEAAECWKGTTDNTATFELGKAFDALHFWLEYPGGVVGPAIAGYVFGASNDKPVATPTLRLTASAGDITATGASIAYTLRASSEFDGTEVAVLCNGALVTENPVVLTGLTPSTEYTYTLKAVANIAGTDYESNEAVVKFRTIRDGATAAVWHGRADGMLANAYYTDETPADKRSLPVSIDVEASYNPDMTITFTASVITEKPVTGMVAPNIVAVGEPRRDNQPDHVAMEGTYEKSTFTTTGTYEEGDRMAWFTFDIIYADGGNTNIGSLNNQYTVGQENSPVEVGEPAAIEIMLPKTSLKVAETVPATVVLRDAAGHYVFGRDVTLTSNSAAFGVEGFYVTAADKGSATITATCGELTATVDMACVVSADSKALGGTVTGDVDGIDYSLIVDGNEGTQIEWSCAETQAHYAVIDLGSDKIVEAVELVWEGASAKEYTVTLMSGGAPEETVFRAPSTGEYTMTETAGIGGAGVTARRLFAVEGEGHSTRYVRIDTKAAYEPTWGIKLKEVSVMGKDKPGYIDGIDADASAETEYYNLQGVRVEGEFAPGLYIRRQGNTVAKVVVK